MSILALYTRATPGVNIAAAAGAPVGEPNQGLYATNSSAEAVEGSALDHASQGLPISALGRVVVSPGSPVDYYNQGVPYSAAGNVVTGPGPIDYYDQGTGFNADGEIVTV